MTKMLWTGTPLKRTLVGEFAHEVPEHIRGDMLRGIVSLCKVAIDSMQNFSLLYLQAGSTILPRTTAALRTNGVTDLSVSVA
jgi:hypothetical protein